MSTIRRAIAASVLALPLTLAAGAGLASADTYVNSDTSVGPDGAAASNVIAGTVNGSSFYHAGYTSADATGATSAGTNSAATPDGQAGYEHHSTTVGENGITTHYTGASTGSLSGGKHHHRHHHGVLGGWGLFG